MIKILKEPLFSFLLLGGAIFALYQVVAGNGLAGIDQSEDILITENEVLALAVGFEKVWQRLPNENELDSLLDEYVREEILYREALALGLDRNDAIIRRRLRQKLEFLTEDIAVLKEPSEDELQSFLNANSESYLEESSFSFQQVYFNISQRGASGLNEAEELLMALNALSDDDSDKKTALLESGDRLMLTQINYESAGEREVLRVLGRQFLEEIKGLPLNSWQGPVESGFGLHLVFLSEYAAGGTQPLENVYEQVLRDWTVVKRKEANDEFYAVLRHSYTVTIDGLLSEPEDLP